MKKWIALLLSAMLMLSMLAGCGGDTDKPVTDTPAPGPGPGAVLRAFAGCPGGLLRAGAQHFS